MKFLPTNWQTTVGGIIFTLGIVVEVMGQVEIGKGLQALSVLIVGSAAADKAVTKAAMREVREDIAEVKYDAKEAKQVADDDRAASATRR
jgi:hypothetical protein